jgi:hypothetical protein
VIHRYFKRANLLYATFAALNCDALVNYLLSGTGFLVWRQLLWLVALAVFGSALSEFSWSKRERYFINFQLLSLAILIFLGIYTLFAQEFSILRVSYSIWIMAMGIPFFVSGRLLELEDPENVKRFLRFFSFFGLFLSIGLLIDSKTSLFYPVKASMLGDEVATDEALNGENRAYFLSTSLTSFTIPYVFCMLSSFLMISKTVDIKWQSFHLFCAMSCVAGSWFTGSRQIFFILSAYFILGIGLFLAHSKVKGKGYLIGGVVVFAIIASNMAYVFIENLKLSDRYKVGNILEDDRRQFWSKGMNTVVYNGKFPELIVGSGLGYATSNMARGGEFVGDHYENTFLYRMSEAGILGLFILLLPPVFIISCVLMRRNYRYSDFLILGLVAGYFIVCFISPNGSYPSTLMIIYVLAGILSSRKIYDNISCANSFGEPLAPERRASPT